jgi:beta-glucanase (GH16 family)
MSAQFSLKAKFGMIPKTSVLEEKENKLKQDYEEFKAFSESEELARFKQLDEFVNSNEFEQAKKEINAKKYPGSKPAEKEKKYKELKKSKKIKTYYQLKDSKELSDYNSFKDSEKLANYEELEQFFTSPEFNEFKKSLIQQKEEKTKIIKEKLANYKSLKKKFKWFFTLKESKQLADFIAFKDSKVLEDFLKLKEYIESINFDSLDKKENAEEFSKLKEFKSQEKSSKIKNYFKFKDSEKYANYLNLDGSEEIDNFIELEQEVNSNEFKNHIQEVKNIKFENTEEYKKQKEYKVLKNSADIKQYYKFKDSEKLKIYNELNNSQEIADFEELERYINSDEFKEEKKYLQIKDKFKLSEEFKQAEEYKALKKSEKIIWYQKLEKKNDFDKLYEWNLTFEDDFEGNKLDSEKWMSGYYWGKNLLNDDYVLVTEKQFFKESNLELTNSNLKIITKAETTKGKVWDPALGFYEKEFNYTSGLINTGHFFRQQYGLFKAKIKLNHSYPVHHAFWMLGEKITPEIDVFKYVNKSASKVEVANYWNGDGSIKQHKKALGGLNFSKDYYIYSLEWTPEKLTWKINDVVLYEQTQGIPTEPMYIILSSGILKDSNFNGQATMEVDWVRAYEKKSNA